MPNRFMSIPANADLGTVINQANQNFAILDNEAVTKTFNNGQGTIGLVDGRLPNDLGTGTLLYGLDGKALISMRVDPSGNPELKIAKAGFDATTASAANLIFNSAQNTFKIVATGTLTVKDPSVTAGAGVYASGRAIGAAAHNLGFIPVCIAAMAVGPSYTNLPYSNVSGGGSSATWQTFWVNTDANNVYVYDDVTILNGTSSSNTWTIKYYLLQETAN